MRLAHFDVSVSQIARPASLGLPPPVGFAGNATGWGKNRELPG